MEPRERSPHSPSGAARCRRWEQSPVVEELLPLAPIRYIVIFARASSRAACTKRWMSYSARADSRVGHVPGHVPASVEVGTQVRDS